MALNFLSKHGIIIGTVTGLTSLLIILDSVFRVNRVFPQTETETETITYSTSYKIQFVGAFLLAVVSVILSSLLIVGIVKKRHLLLVPWLVVAFLLSLFLSYLLISEIVTRTYFPLDDLLILIALIGSAIIVLYPILQLFTEIRSGYSALVYPKVPESNYVQNIQTTYGEISKKAIV